MSGCRAVFLDAGGVIVLPDRHLLAGALARAGIGSTRRRSRGPTTAPSAPSTAPTGTHWGTRPRSSPSLELSPDGRRKRSRPGSAWPTAPGRGASSGANRRPGPLETIDALRRAGIAVVIVTNSDGHAAENLAAAASPASR